MKIKPDIESKLKEMPKAYKVPADYFENLEKNFHIKNKPVSKIKIYAKWMVAATIIWIFGVHWINKKTSGNPNIQIEDTVYSQQPLITEPDDLDDLSDDEIVNYFENQIDNDEILDLL